MKFVSVISELENSDGAVRDALDQAHRQLEEPDLVMVYVAGHDAELWNVLPGKLRSYFPRAVTLGATVEGVIGAGREIEREPSITVIAAALPGVELNTFSVSQDRLQDDPSWTSAIPAAEQAPILITLAEPFTIDVRQYLSVLGETHPGRPVVGGLVSGGSGPGTNRMLLNGVEYRDGVVGVAMTGNLDVTTVVSQGCRPIGEHYVVTQGQANIVRGLRNRPALTVLRETAALADDRDQELLNRGVFLGRAIDEYKSEFGRGDFLIQSIIGADKKDNSFAVAGDVRNGTSVQFHVRDSESADEDLRQMLAVAAQSSGEGPSFAGGLLFSCNGRGTRMWETPDHDVSVVNEILEDVPVGGFFAAGELGPIGGQNFIHGFTASMALFRPRARFGKVKEENA